LTLRAVSRLQFFDHAALVRKNGTRSGDQIGESGSEVRGEGVVVGDLVTKLRVGELFMRRGCKAWTRFEGVAFGETCRFSGADPLVFERTVGQTISTRSTPRGEALTSAAAIAARFWPKPHFIGQFRPAGGRAGGGKERAFLLIAVQAAPAAAY